MGGSTLDKPFPAYPAVFAAFDLLWLDDEDLREYALWERKSLLALVGGICNMAHE